MDSSSSLKRKRDHPSWSSGQDEIKRSSSLDRHLHQPLKHVKSELHGHGRVDRSVSNLSRLDKARSFARKDSEARSGTKLGTFTSTSTEKRSDTGNREKGFMDRGENSQGSSYAPKKLDHLKQNADEKQEGFSRSIKEGFNSGGNLKRARLNVNDMTADTSKALGHGTDYADRSLSKGRVLSRGDRSLEQLRISSERDSFKRILKLKAKHMPGSEGSKESNLCRVRVKEENHLACSPSKSNNGSPDESSSKSSSSARASSRAQNSHSELMPSESLVAETPLLFLHVTRRARSERRRDDSCKSHSSKGASLDGFCAELEEVLLTKQEAEVNSEKQLVAETKKSVVDIVASKPLSSDSGDAFTSAALSGIQKGASLEEADEREEGELEPEHEVTEKNFSGGGNEVKEGEGFEIHVGKMSQDCNDLVNNKGCEEPFGGRQLLSESSRQNITLPAENFERHEEKRRQDSDCVEKQNGCNEASGCSLLHSEPSRHCIAAEGSRDALEAVKSQSVPTSDFVIDSDVISVEEQRNGIARFCEKVSDNCRNDNTDIPATAFNSLKYSHSNMILNAQVTDTSSHGEGNYFSKMGGPLSMEPAAQRQITDEGGESYGPLNIPPTIGEKHIRESHMQTEGGDNRDSTLQVHELDELSGHGHKQKRLKVESLQLSLALPQCPSGSLKSLPKALDNEVSRTQVLRRAQNLSHLRTDSLSNGFTTSLSLSSFVHNPSCSLNFTSLEDQELSCGGSRQTFQLREATSDVEGLGYVKKSLSSRSNTRREHKPISPVSHEVFLDGKLLGSGIGLLSDTIGAIGYITSESTSRNHCALVHGNVTMQDQILRNDAPSFLLKSNSERSKFQEVKSVADVKIGLLEIASEPIAAMAQKLQELPDGFLEGLKGLVKELLGSFAKREEFLGLQQIIRTRTDLSEETLLRAHPTQLEILVSLKTGMQSFVQQGAKSLTYKALIEIFLQTRESLRTLPRPGKLNHWQKSWTMLERTASVQDVCSSILCFFSEDRTQYSPVAPNIMQSSGIENNVEGANKAFATMGSLVARKLSNFVEDNKGLEGRETERAENVKKTDDAAREDAINLQRIIFLKTKEMEEDYSLKFAKLRLDAAEQQRRKRLEELQALERSHREYEIMKLRMETDMKHLMMKIMERSRPQLA
ncbi:hypothetical protein GOP47_0025690 [Adiantum capillus-veneris]|uniref:Oberon coiled-coil region domain-containing protein n=1 Tax=Adiantum capillus-veneris TaxID=13818 RepID=A0A9D4U370_ADICA|nr:hypothetical protein GOP47_0025690 [Adiantum capillus-veneris]